MDKLQTPVAPLVKKMEVLELLWLPKDQSISRSTAGSTIGKSIGKPQEKRCRSDNRNIIERVVLDSVVENEAEQHEIGSFDGEDEMESSAQCW